MNLMPDRVTDWSTPRWTVKIKRMTNGHLLTQRLLLIPLSSFREPGQDRDSYTLQHHQRQDEQVTGLTGHYFSNRFWRANQSGVRVSSRLDTLEKQIHWTNNLQESTWDHTLTDKIYISRNFQQQTSSLSYILFYGGSQREDLHDAIHIPHRFLKEQLHRGDPGRWV